MNRLEGEEILPRNENRPMDVAASIDALARNQ